MSDRLDDEKLETLRGWGAGLAVDGRDELRAAGRAILILIEEIERLQVDLWHTDGEPSYPALMTADDHEDEVAGEGLTEPEQPAVLESALRRRLRQLLEGRLPDNR